MIPDEKIIAALLQNDNIREAAKSLSISERTIYSRLREPPFIQMYRDAKASMLKRATRAFNEKISDAAEVMHSIATDDTVNAAVRLQACQTICNMAVKFSDRFDDKETEVIISDEQPVEDLLEAEIRSMFERKK